LAGIILGFSNTALWILYFIVISARVVPSHTHENTGIAHQPNGFYAYAK
jgi:hypothetical protein